MVFVYFMLLFVDWDASSSPSHAAMIQPKTRQKLPKQLLEQPTYQPSTDTNYIISSNTSAAQSKPPISSSNIASVPSTTETSKLSSRNKHNNKHSKQIVEDETDDSAFDLDMSVKETENITNTQQTQHQTLSQTIPVSTVSASSIHPVQANSPIIHQSSNVLVSANSASSNWNENDFIQSSSISPSQIASDSHKKPLSDETALHINNETHQSSDALIAECAKLQQKCQVERTKREKVEIKLSQQDREVVSLKRSLSQRSSDFSDLSSRFHHLQQENENLRTAANLDIKVALEKADHSLAEREKSLSHKYQQQIDELQSTVNQLQQTLMLKNTEYDDLKSQCQQQQDMIDEQQLVHSTLMNKWKILKEERDRLIESLSQSESVASSKKTLLLSLRQRYDELVSSHLIEISSLENKLESAQKLYDSLEERCAVVTSERDELEIRFKVEAKRR